MKRLLASLALVSAAVLFSFQASKPITLAWDAKPPAEVWSEVRIYDSGTLVATAPCPGGVCPTQVTFTMLRAAHSFTARSYNGDWESADSNVVTVNGPPSAPVSLRKN